jgi:hypothetical protein
MFNKVAYNGSGIYAVVAFPVPSALLKDIQLIRNPMLVTCTSATIA